MLIDFLYTLRYSKPRSGFSTESFFQLYFVISSSQQFLNIFRKS